MKFKTELLLNEQEKTNILGETFISQDFLSIEAKHYNGVYKVCVIKETHEKGMTEFLLFADGNFNVTIGRGRKSDKKLEKIGKIIEENKNKYLELWKNKDYQTIACSLQNQTRELFK